MARQEPMERARDELFSHIHRCGVLKANPEDQDSWMNETMEYLAERYPDLGEKELFQLKAVGMQFCKPIVSRLKLEEAAEPAPELAGEEVASVLGAPQEA